MTIPFFEWARISPTILCSARESLVQCFDNHHNLWSKTHINVDRAKIW